MPYAPTVTVLSDANPCPRAEVLFTSFAAGTARVTVSRQAAGREYRVRAAVNAATAGALSRVDYEIPFGVPVTYRAEMFNTTGLSLGFTDTATVTVSAPDTWVHNPLNPGGAVKVAFRDTALRALSRPVEGDVVYPMGRRVGVVVSGQRRGLRGVRLDVVTDTIEQADAFQALAGGYDAATVPVVCFRVGAADRIRIPRPFYASVMDAVEVDRTYVLGGQMIDHQVVGDEVTPPTEALLVSLLRNADIKAFYATNAAIRAANATNLAVTRRYELAGYAG